MEEKGIKLILIQIDEAHSSAWPKALPDQPEPHANIEDRTERAQFYVNAENPPFDVYIDTWNNDFEQRFHAWPDKFYMINSDKTVMEKSKYGAKRDAMINHDYAKLLAQILQSDDIISSDG